jgi:hypothetical protein
MIQRDRDTSVFAEISQYRQEISYKNLAEAQRNGEIGFINNPSLPGGKKENFNPYTGAEKNNNNNQTTKNYNNARGKNNGQQQPQKQNRHWEPYSRDQEEDSYQGRGGKSEGSRNRDSRDERDQASYRRDNDDWSRDHVKG